MKRSGKFYGLCSSLYVRMEYVSAKMSLIFRMNSPTYGCELQGFRTALQCAISRSDVVCLLGGIFCGVRLLQSNDCRTYIGHCTTERLSADVCLK